MDRLNDAESLAVRIALLKDIATTWERAAQWYERGWTEAADTIAESITVVHSAYCKLLEASYDPTPVDETPVPVNTCDGNHTFGRCPRGKCDFEFSMP